VKGKLAVLAVFAGFLIYQIPFVKYLVWLNAAAICERIGMRGSFIWVAIFEMAVVAAVLWILSSKIVDLWETGRMGPGK